jgi:hypothetical protein
VLSARFETVLVDAVPQRKSRKRVKDAALHRVDIKGVRYIAFRPKDVGVPLPVLMTCVDAYMGTEAEATKAGLWIPGNDIAIGVVIFTPMLGFYGDPRAWRSLPKR